MSSTPTPTSLTKGDTLGLRAAIAQARKSLAEGGIPIGSSLVSPTQGNANTNTGEGGFEVLAAGHNERIQKGSAILHGEMAMLEKAGRLKADVYRRCTLVSVSANFRMLRAY